MKSKIEYHDQKMNIPVETGFVVRVPKQYDELKYVVYEAPYCWMYFDDNKYQIDATLQSISENLPVGTFFQCNRSTLINLDRCKRSKKSKYKIAIVMDDDTEHELSRRRKKDFFKAMYERPTKRGKPGKSGK